ncbi:hypothetical protein PILCRDRAFT_7104 [Piloderma croceum F 1598]|uniref:Uncharacterized protein n=1 Tax=Piloderma croceum (strain F 1598) TaxID=765440 RepID=A0A0C3BBP1_PILCF|nr:hypothetical protein PILCRDRAFT_7104 [Piloderma croceum F 1598]
MGLGLGTPSKTAEWGDGKKWRGGERAGAKTRNWAAELHFECAIRNGGRG